MPDHFCISVTFLDKRFHGRGDRGEPEWPPSPLRLLQAIVAANGDDVHAGGTLDQALAWLEQQEPPMIFAPKHLEGTPYCLSVPNNAMDIVGRAWSRGNYFGSGDANPATHRTMKTVRPVRMLEGDTLHYVWSLSNAMSLLADMMQSLTTAARRVVALGWGIDLVVARADQLSTVQLGDLPGEKWKPTVSTSLNALRIPIQGSVAALQKRYREFTRRISETGFVPVEPLTRFNVTGYRRPTDPITCPTALFELRHDDDSFCTYSQRKLIHIAGMVRHLAKELMLQAPPADVDEDWVEMYVVGHRNERRSHHRQLAYLPLPSVGHRHADQLVRRVMIAAPVGDDAWLEHIARRLAGQRLKPERGDEFGDKGPPTLMRVYRDNIARYYTRPSNTWASVTPVILPGHDDRKPAKTRRLIKAALAQSGIEQACTFEWSSFSNFRKSLSAHKYNKDKKPTGYIRPDYLLTNTAVHLTLRFADDMEVSGPLAIGAGRYCGLGIFALPQKSE